MVFNLKEQIQSDFKRIILEKFAAKSMSELYMYLKKNKYYTQKTFDTLSKEYHINWDILPENLIIKLEGNLELLKLDNNTLYFWIVEESKSAEIKRIKKGSEVIVNVDVDPGLAAVSLGRKYITERNKKAFKKIDDAKQLCTIVYSVDINKALKVANLSNDEATGNELTKLQKEFLKNENMWVHCKKKIEAIQFFKWASQFNSSFTNANTKWDVYDKDTCYNIARPRLESINDLLRDKNNIIIKYKDLFK